MTIRLQKLWETTRASYWFIPSLMAAGAAGLAFGMITLDREFGAEIADKLGWIFSGGPDGARQVLSTVASSMITVAGVAFSITIVALTLASSQFGPRLLNNFMRDTGNQVVLGTFIATYLYCLLILRTIHGAEEIGRFVPNLSITVGVLLAVVSLGVLIYFIHHVAVSIQAPNVIGSVAHDLHHTIDRLYPKQIGRGPPSHDPSAVEREVPADFESGSCPILALNNGYLQAIDQDQAIDVAQKYDLLLRFEHRPGDFLIRDDVLVRAWPGERVDKEVADKVRRLFVLGAQRTPTQDVEFSVDQLVEVAVRALSPGINDPFTAMNCLDRLGAGLCHLARREIPSGFRRDEDDRLRVIATGTETFVGIVDAAFHQIRQYGRDSVAVTIRSLEVIKQVVECVDRDPNRAVLLKHAEMICRGAQEALPEPQDRLDVTQRYQAVLQAAEHRRNS